MSEEFTNHSESAPEEHAHEGVNKLEGAHAQIKQAADEFKTAASAKAEEIKNAAAAKAGEFKAVASAKVDDLRAAASLKAEEFKSVASEKAEEYRGKAEAAFAEAKGRARGYQTDGEAYVRENPTRAVVGAVAAGFILGLLLRK